MISFANSNNWQAASWVVATFLEDAASLATNDPEVRELLTIGSQCRFLLLDQLPPVLAKRLRAVIEQTVNCTLGNPSDPALKWHVNMDDDLRISYLELISRLRDVMLQP